MSIGQFVMWAVILIVAVFAGLLIRTHRVNKRKRRQPVRNPAAIRDALAKGYCPDCRQKALLEGPSGGMSQNVACDNCLSEFNVGYGFNGEVWFYEPMGKLTFVRAQIYGIGPEQVATSLGNPQ